jgi:DNA-directed RNA polymerase specialized sigma24 family protein
MQSTNNYYVEKLYKSSHKQLSGYAYSFTRDVDDAKELTQYMYFYLLSKNIDKLITEDDNINVFYCLKIIKHAFFASSNRIKRLTAIDAALDKQVDEYDNEADELFEYQFQHIFKALDKIEETDAKIFRVIHLDKKYTAPELSDKTGINHGTINAAIRRVKEQILESWVSPIKNNIII